MLNEILRTAHHSIISVGALFVFGRMLGKKQISQLTFFDYIVGISIGSIAAQSAIDPSVSFAQGITGIAVFALFELVLSIISLKSYAARKLLDGTPAVLIENGKIIEKALRKTHLTVNDLLEECRLKDAFDIADVDYAVLETSGKLSVMLKPQKNSSLCTNLIIDGKVIAKHLSAINRDEIWLDAQLSNSNVKESDVLLAYTDSSGNLKWYLKNIEPTITSTL